jgi:excisionase family DNA binding protein
MPNNLQDDTYCSTREAARMLGVSLGTVQNMVERGTLSAWKTAGGHRRVSMRAIEAYLAQRQPQFQAPPATLCLKVLIAEDDPFFQEQYRLTMNSWGLPLDLKIVGNGYESLVQIGLDRPDVVIVDLMLPGMDGFEVIRTLRGKPELSTMNIMVISSLNKEEIAARGGVPETITIYGKPVPFHEIRGYLQALITQRSRMGRRA